MSCLCCGALVSPRPWWTRNRRRFAYCERCYRGECEKCKVPTPEERAPSSLPAGGKRCKACGHEWARARGCK